MVGLLQTAHDGRFEEIGVISGFYMPQSLGWE